jgi:hypothetical protein
MGWEKRNGRRYFYRGVRVGDRVRKRYFGAGIAGELAARMDALRRAERKAQKEAWEAAAAELDAAEEPLRILDEGCELVIEGVLYSLGFHRPTRHAWRRWRNGRQEIEEELGADGA